MSHAWHRGLVEQVSQFLSEIASEEDHRLVWSHSEVSKALMAWERLGSVSGLNRVRRQ